MTYAYPVPTFADPATFAGVGVVEVFVHEIEGILAAVQSPTYPSQTKVYLVDCMNVRSDH